MVVKLAPKPSTRGLPQTARCLNGPPELGAFGEVPSFLYAMPLTPKRVFLEETCLVARPALPFAVLKRRLMRRLDALGIKVPRGLVGVQCKASLRVPFS